MKASEYRARGRRTLKGNWPRAVVAGAVALLFGAAADGHSMVELRLPDLSEFPGLWEVTGETLEQLCRAIPQSMLPWLGTATNVALVLGMVLWCGQLILGGAVAIGYRRYLLNLVDGVPASLKELFSQFHRMGQGLVLRLISWIVIPAPVVLLAVVTFVAALFEWVGIVIPLLIGNLIYWCFAIYAAYGISMAEYVLAENPELSALQGVKASWQMMNGHRWELFCLELSFIGWSILASVFGVVGTLALTPYLQTTVACFYRNLRGQANPSPET